MKHRPSLCTVLASLTVLSWGCSPSAEGTGADAGTGGESTAPDGGGSGGANGSGGSGTGGRTPGTGGSIGSGGAPGSGGREGTGGAVGSGGRGTGGAVGSGGAMGSGGRVSTGGVFGGGGRGSGGAVGTGGVPTGSGGRGTGGSASGGATGTGGSSSMCGGTPLSGGTQHCSSNAQGNLSGGYSWTIWSSGTGGCITPYGVGAAFKATWNDSKDFLSRVGLSLGSNKTYDKFGTFTADFAETKTGTGGGYSYIGIYGWSVNPLHEFYIVDDWFGSRPNPGTKIGSITVDGGTYDILTQTQTNQPAITGGNATFVQFWSLRTTPRTCGHISISEHFKAWANAGLVLGNMEEAKVLIEVGGGMGSIDFTSATLTAN